MRLWSIEPPKLSVKLRSASSQLSLQVFPLVEQLSFAFFDLTGGNRLRKFSGVKTITPSFSFSREAGKESRNASNWLRLRSETSELWMVRVTSRGACQNLLREQCLTPRSNQSLWVEIFGVKSPEAHISPVNIVYGVQKLCVL
jgi:hypothetical protein